MITKEVTVINKLGLHARAAAKFVTCASQYLSEIHLDYNGKIVNGKSIMGVMMLAAGKGSELVLRAEGDDEKAAMTALEKLIGDRFGESE